MTRAANWAVDPDHLSRGLKNSRMSKRTPGSSLREVDYMRFPHHSATRFWLNAVTGCGAVFLILSAAAMTLAQDSMPQRGLYPNGAYDATGVDTINTTNGNLYLNIPLASLPSGRGGQPGFTLRLHYNSKLYNAFIQQETQPNGSIFNLRMLERNHDADRPSWRYNLKYQVAEEALVPFCSIPGGRDIWKLRLVFPDGSSHEFRPVGYDDYANNGFFPIRKDGVQPCGLPTVTTPLTYYSTDSTYLRLVFPNDGVSPWTLYFPDGSRIVNATEPGVGGQRHYDHNGNFTDFLTVTLPDGNEADKIVDTLQRSIIVEHDVAAHQDYVITAGFGEEVRLTIKWGATIVNKTYDALWGCSHSYPKTMRLGQSVVEQITLPAQAGGLTFKFQYNGKAGPLAPPPDPVESPGWGELSAMTLPSGAKIYYHYFHDDGEQPPWEGRPCWRQVLKNYPVRKELVYRDENDRGYNASSPANSTPCDPATESCVTETWTYDMGDTFATDREMTTIADPAGGVTKQYYFDSDGGTDYHPTSNWRSGLVYKLETPDGTAIERDWQPNKPFGSDASASVQMNPYVKFEYRSLPNAAHTALVKKAGTEYNYDKNGNLTQTKDYDWVNYGSDPLSGTLLRRTVNDYYNPTPDAATLVFSPNSYHAANWLHIWNALKSTEVRDDSGQPLARSDFRYDDENEKGNLTRQFNWDSSKAGYSNPLCTDASQCTLNVNSLAYEYDTYGNRTLSTDGGGRQTKFIYDAVGGVANLYATRTIVAFGTSVQRSMGFEYDFNTGLLTRTTDLDNNVSNETDYDALGRPVENRTAANIAEAKTTTHAEYADSSRYIVTRSDLNTAYDHKLVTIQHYDQLGRIRLSRQLEEDAQSAADETTGVKVQTRYKFFGSNSYQVVSNPYRASLSSSAGSEVTMGWTRSKSDNAGRLIEVQTYGGQVLPAPWGSNSTFTGTSTTVYDAEFTSVTDQDLRWHRGRTDSLGRMVRVDEPDKDTGVLDGQDGNPVQPTNYLYDAMGNLRQVTQGSQQRYFMYDSLSRLIRARNPEQKNNPALDLPDTVTPNHDWSIKHVYDNTGNLVQTIDARGIVIDYAYDELNRNKSVTASDANTPVITRTYDEGQYGKGRLRSTQTSGATGSLTTIDAYDALGQPTRTIQTLGTKSYLQIYSYDRSGHVKTIQYPSGHTVTYDYDNAGRTSSFVGNLGDGGAPRNYSTNISYSPLGELSQEQFGTATSIYNKLFYNSRGQLAEIRDGLTPSNDSWERGAIINFFSTCAGKCYENGVSVSMPGNNGNLKRQEYWIQDGNGGVLAMPAQTYDYDQLNRIKRVYEGSSTQPVWQQQFAYDRYGNRTLTSDSLLYNAFEIETSTNRLLAPGDSNLVEGDRRMGYDEAGNLIRDTYTSQGQRTYDAQNRMTQALANNHSQEYVYNGDGQRVRRKVDGVWTWQVHGLRGELLAEYAAEADHAAPQKEYGYRNGQLLITATAATSWGAPPTLHDDPLNPNYVGQTTVQSRHITELRAAIDAVRIHLGQSSYSWQEPVGVGDPISANPILEMRVALDQALGAPQTGYSPGLAQWQPIMAIHIQELRNRVLAAWNTGGTDVRWLVSDHLGTPRMIFDQAGSVANMRRHDYLPFGEDLAAGGRGASLGYDVAGPRQKFTGKERDDETGLDYFLARYYSSTQGRFTSPDEFKSGPHDLWVQGRGHSEEQPLVYADITNPQSLNKYQYAFNNPVRFVDPDGQKPQDGYELNLRRDEKALLEGKMTPEEFNARQRARGVGAAIGAVAVLMAIYGPEIAESILLWAARNPDKVEQLAQTAQEAAGGPPVLTLLPKSRLTAEEIDSGERLVKLLNYGLSESAHVGEEFLVTGTKKAIDVMGTPRAYQFWNQGQFFNQIRRHLLKSVDYVVIDLKGASQQQIKAITEYVKSLTKQQQDRIIYLIN